MAISEQTSQRLLISWNVNGVRAIYKKDFMDWLAEARPDILCLQETRAEAHQIPADLRGPDDYHAYWNHSIRKKGYSGTGLLTRQQPDEVIFGLGVPEFDQEGRTLIAHYPDFTLVNCYFPNGGRDHKRVPFKLAFYDAFLRRMEALRGEGRNIIFCGDVNTAHKPIDLTHPKTNQNTTGFLPEERAWMDAMAADYVDSFRHSYLDRAEMYTWWSMPARTRQRNVGWRIDYFFAASELMPRVTDALIFSDVMGSDHCPVGIKLLTES